MGVIPWERREEREESSEGRIPKEQQPLHPAAPVLVGTAAPMMGSGSVLWEWTVWNPQGRARLRILLPCPVHI